MGKSRASEPISVREDLTPCTDIHSSHSITNEPTITKDSFLQVQCRQILSLQSSGTIVALWLYDLLAEEGMTFRARSTNAPETRGARNGNGV